MRPSATAAVMGWVLVALAALGPRLTAQQPPDDAAAMLTTVRRGLEVRDDQLAWLSVRVSSHIVRDADYDKWRAQQLTVHFGREYTASPPESWQRYELRRTPEAYYYSETLSIPQEGAQLRPTLEIAVHGDEYVSLQAPGSVDARVLVNTGAAEELRFVPPLTSFLLMTYGDKSWSEATKGTDWRWLGIQDCEGSPCHVLATAASMASSTHAVWVDAAAGFAVRRHVSRYPNGEMKLDVTVQEFRQDQQGIWLPTTVISRRYSSTQTEADGASYGENRLVTQITNVAEYADPQQLQEADFDVTVPKGTLLYDTATGEWSQTNGDGA